MNMKKISVFLLLIAVMIMGIISYANEKTPVQIGEWVGSSVRDILSDENFNTKLSPNEKNINDKDRTVGNILGENITARELEVRAKLFELSGSKAPLEEAWDSLKVNVYEKQFAAEHNLTPSKQEIIDFTQEMRDRVESTPEGREYAKALIEAAGMTEDEYWNDYKIKNESPSHLTSIKISEYLFNNNLPELNKEEIIKNIDDKIIDQQIKEEYEIN
ncbi:MAG: hypothetical protein E7222_09500 [Clostridiales bacterium]|nr:hypothetical protein [Clostridiales bacterium]